MARTVKGRDRFRFKITIVPPGQQFITKPWRESCQWKYRTVYLMKMYLTIQIKKASAKANYKWYKYYTVSRYGAPSTREFICPYSGMVATTIKQDDAKHIRRYWSDCAKKSAEVLNWLNELDPQLYTADLNHYLRALIVLPPNMREYQDYENQNPFKKPRQWREL